MFLDAASQAFISSEVGQWIGRSANVPVYVMTDASFGTGAVGGSLASVEAFGKRAGEMARLILTGTLPVALPFEIRTDSVPTFDGRALKRWNISEGRLPANSVVRFRPESLWEQYRWYILGGLIILAQSAIIANLFLQRRRVSYVKTKLQESQQLMELATSGAELGLWSRDLRNGDLAANAPARSLFGFGPTDRLRYDEMLARVHPDDRTRMQSEIERTAAIGQPFQGEFRTVLPGGTERWVLAKGRTVVERGRHDGHRMGVLLDITERKRAEEALRETEGRLARTEEFSLVMVTHTDLEGRWLKVPPTLCKLLGYTERELLGRRFHELTHPDDLKGNVEQRLRLLRGEIKSFDIEKRYIRKDGGIVWVYVNVSIVTDAKDNPIHCLSYIRDITERKRAEEALRESEGLRRAIFESQPVCVKLVAPDYRLLDMNPAGLAMIEADCLRQVVGQSVMAIIVPEWHATYENLHRRVCRGESAVAQFEIIGLKGKRHWMESHAAPLRSKDGDIIALVAISHDISDRKRAEQDLEEALSEVKRLKEQLEVENVYLRSEVSGVHRYGEIIGASEGIQKVFEQVDRVAPTDMTVLILGETGTGKELVARLVHEKSARSERPLVKVNCSTLPAELIESELFGHERGAFTGAVSKQVGRFELADGGTIFLDEVGEVPLRLQSKLLRVLQEGEFERLGSGKTIKVDVRMIAATNRNLSEAAQRGRFRADLYYRLNVYPIELPPLRDRRGDIGLLSEVFLNEATRRLGKSFGKIPNEVIEALRAYSWPGNVRELENVISRAAVLSTAAALQLPEGWNKAPVTGLSCTPLKTIPEPLSLRSESPQSMPTLEQFERTRILEVLDQTNWRIEGPKGAAMILGLHPNTLRSRLRKLGITKAPKLRNSVETTK